MALLSKAERRHFPDWDNPAQCIFCRVEIDAEKCNGCKLCALVCPANVLELYGEKGHKKARVMESIRGCASCNNCQAICESGAIAVTGPYDFAGYYRQLGRGAFAMPRKF
jgi:formate hydrogenlyase subunit 6/NADH:ubiquinone oxidoreductase subunit I